MADPRTYRKVTGPDDRLAAAAAVLGVDANDFTALKHLSLEQLRARIRGYERRRALAAKATHILTAHGLD